MSDLGLRVVEIDDRRRALGDQIGVALDVALGAFELRLVARDDWPSTCAICASICAAIEREQQIALLDHARRRGNGRR